jgi:hypothetical protein
MKKIILALLLLTTTNAHALIQNADIKANAAIDATKLIDGSVSNTELGYINSLTSNAQTQLSGKLDTANFTDAAVTGKLITGYVSGAGVVAATDTILQAINKLNGNIAAIVPGSGDVVGPASAVNNNVCFFDGVTGKLIKDSGLTLSGSNTGDQTITLTGDVTGSGTGSFATTLTNASVTGQPITGYVSGAGTVAATDTILQAIQKLNGNVAAISPGITQLTGDVTAGPGSGSQAATIAANSVTNAKMAQMATQTIKGRTTAGTGDPEDLTATQATAILNAMVGDSGSGGTKGLAPAPASGDAAAGKFLKADGTWAVPAGGGSGDGLLYSSSTPGSATWTVPADTYAVWIRASGGGGGGGSNGGGTTGSGGGGGSYAEQVLRVVPGASITVTVGAGGAAASAGGDTKLTYNSIDIFTIPGGGGGGTPTAGAGKGLGVSGGAGGGASTPGSAATPTIPSVNGNGVLISYLTSYDLSGTVIVNGTGGTAGNSSTGGGGGGGMSGFGSGGLGGNGNCFGGCAKTAGGPGAGGGGGGAGGVAGEPGGDGKIEIYAMPGI